MTKMAQKFTFTRAMTRTWTREYDVRLICPSPFFSTAHPDKYKHLFRPNPGQKKSSLDSACVPMWIVGYYGPQSLHRSNYLDQESKVEKPMVPATDVSPD